MLKILDITGGSVSAEQQGIFNKISTNNSDGYVQGYKGDFAIIKGTSNTILISPGIMSLQGIRLVNDATETITVSATPQQPTAYHTILKYTHMRASENDSYEFISRPVRSLRKDNLYGGGNNLIYEVELCKYTLTSSGIIDFKQTLAKINYEVVEIEKLLAQANADSSNALSTANEAQASATEALSTATNVKNSFNDLVITKGAGTLIKNKGVAQGELNWEDKINTSGNGGYASLSDANIVAHTGKSSIADVTYQDFVNSLKLNFGEGTKFLYYENNSRFSFIRDMIIENGGFVNSYNYISFQRLNSNSYLIISNAGYWSEGATKCVQFAILNTNGYLTPFTPITQYVDLFSSGTATLGSKINIPNLKSYKLLIINTVCNNSANTIVINPQAGNRGNVMYQNPYGADTELYCMTIMAENNEVYINRAGILKGSSYTEENRTSWAIKNIVGVK